MMTNTAIRSVGIRRILRLILCVLLGGVTAMIAIYSAMALLFGLQLRGNLSDARQTCKEVTVEVEQISRADNSRLWYAVVLKMEGAPARIPGNATEEPEKHNPPDTAIYATTVNPSLEIGQKLSAYYNEETNSVELVDFELETPLLLAGGIGLGVDILLLIFFIIRIVRTLRHRKRMSAPIDPDVYT